MLETSLLEDILEIYTKTPEGLPLCKAKNVKLSYENMLKEIIILSSDLAAYFDIKHNDLLRRNVTKLQREQYLLDSDQLRTFAQLIEVGKSAQKIRTVYC
ncbi:hypothetical protein TI03_02015 [Achromatium sp. WMS1]|nr:hypothetical protein TI03_02015 [Achromatium sp. WMS1]